MRKLQTLLILLLSPSSLFFAGCAEKAVQLTTTSPANKISQRQGIRVSAPESDAAEPSIASAPDGTVYVVWVEHSKDKEADVILQHFDNEAKPLSERVRVNPELGKATAWRGDPPSIAVGADGAVYVGWTARIDSASSHHNANDLFLSVSRDNGRSFNAPVRVNDDKLPAVHGMHSLAVDKTGRVYLAWLDERYLKKAEEPAPENQPTGHQDAHSEANREVYFAVSRDGGKTVSTNSRLTGDACPCCKTDTAVGPDGRVYVSWRQVLPDNYRHIAIASSNNGSSFAQPVIVSDDHWQIAGCPVSGAAMVVGTDNKLKVLWFSAGDRGKAGIYVAESNDNGKTFSERIMLSEGASSGRFMIFADNQNNYRTVFEKAGKVWIVNDTPSPQTVENQQEVIDGELPAAVAARNQILIASINKENDKRSIQLSVLK
jgi:hypothetical protein